MRFDRLRRSEQRERRCDDREADREDGTDRRRHANFGECNDEQLRARHPRGAQYGKVVRRQEQLSANDLSDDEQHGESSEQREDRQRDRLRADRPLDSRDLVRLRRDEGLTPRRWIAADETRRFSGEPIDRHARTQTHEHPVEPVVVGCEPAHERGRHHEIRNLVERRDRHRVGARGEDADDAHVESANVRSRRVLILRHVERVVAAHMEMELPRHDQIRGGLVRVVDAWEPTGVDLRAIDRVGVPAVERSDDLPHPGAAVRVDVVQSGAEGEPVDAGQSGDRVVVTAEATTRDGHQKIRRAGRSQIARVGAFGPPGAGCGEQHGAACDADEQRDCTPGAPARPKLRAQPHAHRRHPVDCAGRGGATADRPSRLPAGGQHPGEHLGRGVRWGFPTVAVGFIVEILSLRASLGVLNGQLP